LRAPGWRARIGGEHQQIAEHLPDGDHCEGDPREQHRAREHEGNPQPDAQDLKNDMDDDLPHGKTTCAMTGPGDERSEAEAAAAAKRTRSAIARAMTSML
jgi:hypothetical protein